MPPPPSMASLLPLKDRARFVQPSARDVGAGSPLALHWRCTMLALVLSGCGGLARSDGAAEELAPREGPASLPELPPAAPRDPGTEGTQPLQTEPDPPLSSPMPSECRGVVGSSGTLAIEVRNQRELAALAGCGTIVGDLTIQPFEGVDLRPLASLRTVLGVLTLGSLYDEPAASGFPSLEGLDNLEAVGALSLRGVLAPSLRALGKLRRFADDTFSLSNGHLFIDYCAELTDLSGLERLEGLVGVVLKNNVKLTSLRGIQLPEVMDFLEVWDSPVEDLGDISRLTEVRNTLWFNNTALQSAAGLERVARVDQLQFWANSALRDLSALSALTQLRYLNLVENPQLETPPVLNEMQRLTGLVVAGNAKLRELPNLPLRALNEAWIENNASLELIPSLSEVRQAYQLRVANNPLLSVLDLGQLQEVRELWVTNNPALDDTALRRLESSEYGTVRIAGNLGQPLPLEQCPWTGEGLCDEVEHPYGVCAEGTDPDCVLPE